MLIVFIVASQGISTLTKHTHRRRLSETPHAHLQTHDILRLHTDAERHESSRDGLFQRVVLVQPTVRVEGERVCPAGRVHVRLIEVGNDQCVLGQMVAPQRHWLGGHVCNGCCG